MITFTKDLYSTLLARVQGKNMANYQTLIAFGLALCGGIVHCSGPSSVPTASIEERIEERLDVPESVQAYKRMMERSQEMQNQVLVELAPGMRQYLATTTEGGPIRFLARNLLHICDTDLSNYLFTPANGEHYDFSPAFRLRPSDFLYKKLEEIAVQRDRDNNRVLAPEELY